MLLYNKNQILPIILVLNMDYPDFYVALLNGIRRHPNPKKRLLRVKERHAGEPWLVPLRQQALAKEEPHFALSVQTQSQDAVPRRAERERSREEISAPSDPLDGPVDKPTLDSLNASDEIYLRARTALESVLTALNGADEPPQTSNPPWVDDECGFEGFTPVVREAKTVPEQPPEIKLAQFGSTGRRATSNLTATPGNNPDRPAHSVSERGSSMSLDTGTRPNL